MRYDKNKAWEGDSSHDPLDCRSYRKTLFKPGLHKVVTIQEHAGDYDSRDFYCCQHISCKYILFKLLPMIITAIRPGLKISGEYFEL